jgi:hypothetical protein
MTVHLFPTHPRLSQPVPHPRGWVILGLGTLSWLAFVLCGYGLLSVLS